MFGKYYNLIKRPWLIQQILQGTASPKGVMINHVGLLFLLKFKLVCCSCSLFGANLAITSDTTLCGLSKVVSNRNG